MLFFIGKRDINESCTKIKIMSGSEQFLQSGTGIALWVCENHVTCIFTVEQSRGTVCVKFREVLTRNECL